MTAISGGSKPTVICGTAAAGSAVRAAIVACTNVISASTLVSASAVVASGALRIHGPKARAAIRERAREADPERALQHVKELAARVAFLRMTTPRPAGEPLEGAGRFVWRGGEWTDGGGESKGARCAAGRGRLPPGRLRGTRAGILNRGLRAELALQTEGFGPVAPRAPHLSGPTQLPVPPPSSKTPRSVADGSISMEEAKQRNAQHYERFYGRKRAKDMFF